MKINLLNESKQSLGGGFSFIDNFYTGMIGRSDEIVNDWRQSDVVLVPSASMVSKETFKAVKEAGKKIVLRVDNIPRNSRNRGTGTSRLKMMSDAADLVVFQSKWAFDYVGYFLKRGGVVINNGIDTTVFNKEGKKITFNDGVFQPIYLYSRFNRDETKRWEWAWYKYQLIQRRQPEAKLVIVGQFSQEQVDFNFDFYNNENIQYIGIVDNPLTMAMIYRGCDYLLATYSNDAYSNTYQEAMACGCELFEPDMSGGTPELIEQGVIDCRTMVSKYLQVFKTLYG